MLKTTTYSDFNSAFDAYASAPAWKCFVLARAETYETGKVVYTVGPEIAAARLAEVSASQGYEFRIYAGLSLAEEIAA